MNMDLGGRFKHWGGRNLVRFCLVGILCLALAALAVDRTARSRARAAFQKLQGYVATEALLTPADVRALVGRPPAIQEVSDAEVLLEGYTWRGSLRKQLVYARYSRGHEADVAWLLDSVSWNRAPSAGRAGTVGATSGPTGDGASPDRGSGSVPGANAAAQNGDHARAADDKAVSTLIEELKHDNSLVRANAAETLANMGPLAREAVPALIESFRGDTLTVQACAVKALVSIGIDAVPALARAVEGDDGQVRSGAIRTLCRIAPQAKEAVPALVRCLQYGRDDEATRFDGVSGTLLGIGSEAVQALVQALKDENASVLLRSRVAVLLGRFGPEATQAAAALAAASKDGDFRVRYAAAQSLVSIGGPESKAAVPVLFEAIKRERRALDAYNPSDLLNALTGKHPLDKEVVAALADGLKDEDRGVRGYAARLLAEIGPEAATVVPALVNALEDRLDEDPSENRQASVLTALGGIGREAVPALIEALKHNKAQVRAGAARALGAIGPEASEAVPALAKALENKDEICESAAAALAQIGEAGIAALAKALQNARAEIRRIAALELYPRWRPVTEYAPAVPALTKALRDKDVEVRSAAARALGAIAPQDTQAITALGQLLGDEQHSRDAGEALGRIGAAAIPVLIKALADHSGQMHTERSIPVEALSRIGKPAVPALTSALKHRNPGVRSGAASVLGRIGPEAHLAVPALAQAVSDTNLDVRYAATNALDQLASRAAFAVAAHLAPPQQDRIPVGTSEPHQGVLVEDILALIEQLKDGRVVSSIAGTLRDNDANVRLRAAATLGKIFDAAARLGAVGAVAEPAVKPLIATLKDEEATVRANAALALGQIGPDGAAEAVPALIDLFRRRSAPMDPLVQMGRLAVPGLAETLRNNDPMLRRDAAIALQQLAERDKTATQEALPALIDALLDEDTWLRQVIITDVLARTEIGAEAAASVPALIRVLQHGDALVRCAANEVLGRIGPKAKPAVPVLLDALKDENARVRCSAIVALGLIGSNSREVILALQQELKNADDRPRELAAVALRQIGPQAKEKP
jgi:HEAT repeat protein